MVKERFKVFLEKAASNLPFMLFRAPPGRNLDGGRLMLVFEAEGRAQTKVGRRGNMEDVEELSCFPTCLDWV